MSKKGEFKEIESVCTYCGVGCDIVGVIKDNKIDRIYADKDGIISEGKLCIKGKYGFDFVDATDRVREHRVRKSFLNKNPTIKSPIEDRLRDFDTEFYSCDLDTITTIASLKLKEIKEKYGGDSFCAIGGARSSCESAYLFQKFCRESMNSPHIDNCARVCHSPSLKGMKATIGEGAATNPYNDIYKSEFIVVIGSNTAEAHPIVANRIIDMARKKNNLTVIDVRDTKLSKLAKYNTIIPYEANLLVLNMMAYVIIKEELYNKSFIKNRTRGFNELKAKILNDPYANPDFFNRVEGYEYLSELIPRIAREYATKDSMILWGLGVTEHLDGSYAVMAITNLALMTGNIGKSGAGLIALRGQNNVQGVCDMGCLPYYLPDYKIPDKIGLMTPQLIDAMLEGKIKALLNMGEDIAHIHPNLNKIDRALDNLEFIMVQELFMTEIAKRADIIVGVKSGYEKRGIYINAMRTLSLSQPLVESNLPDDWEVLQLLDNKLGGDFNYRDSEDIWSEVTEVASDRFSGAKYNRLKQGMQWPIYHSGDTPILHISKFRTEDGFGRFIYHQYSLRGMVKEILDKTFYSSSGYYLTTGRTLSQYNNSAQTKRSQRLLNRCSEDIILASIEDRGKIGDRVILKSQYGETSPLNVKFTDKMRPKTLFCTFHHSKSKINAIFGDERDELIMTPIFKSIKVEVIPQNV